jgi:L-gulonate 5-dehydrogenase
MLAACTVSKEVIEFRELPVPEPADGEALVRIHHVTLCGTDLHIWEDDYATDLPIIQGHEFAGVIEKLGGGADGKWAVGDRVAVSPMFYCGDCYACGIGRVNACRRMSVYGCYEDGSLVEAMAIPVGKLCRIPDTVPMEIAPLCEPMSIAMQAVNRGRPVPGEKAVVLGCGPIGLLATLYLAELGIDVVAVDTVPERAGFSRTFGAGDAWVIDPAVPFPSPAQEEALADLTAGSGPSLVIEATGMPGSLENALVMVAAAGRVVTVGISDKVAALSMRTLPVKEVDLIGSRNSLNLIGESLELLGRHPEQAAALITHRFPFGALAQAFDTMRDRTQMVGKVAIDMPGTSS